MNRFLLLLLVFFAITPAYSQSVVLSKKVDEQYEDNYGPNMRHYGYFHAGLAVIPNMEDATSSIKNPGSGEYTLGYLYKLKLLPFYALGFDVSLAHTRYSFTKSDLNAYNPYNPLTFASNEKRHLLVNNSVSLEIYQRINFGKRGNTLGNFLDAGLSGSWNYAVKEVIVITGNANDYYDRSRTVNHRLDFPETFSYGLAARIGHNKIALFGRYRLSDYFKDTYSIPELPRLKVGVEIGF